MTVKKSTMLQAAKGGFTNATDAADWLVKQGVPFRDAHAIIGRMVLYCLEKHKSIEDLTMDEFHQLSPIFNESVYDAIGVEQCVAARKVIGGPSKDSVQRHIDLNDYYLKSIDNPDLK